MKRLERPSEEEMNRLLETYGRIKRRLVDWDLSHMDPQDEPPGQGEVVLLIFDDADRLAVLDVDEEAEEGCTLPQTRIQPGETVEGAAERLGREVLGVIPAHREVAALHQMRIRFRGWELERWYFIVTCRAPSGSPPGARSAEGLRFIEIPQEVPPQWARTQWYLWVLKDVGLVHPHFLLLGKPSS